MKGKTLIAGAAALSIVTLFGCQQQPAGVTQQPPQTQTSTASLEINQPTQTSTANLEIMPASQEGAMMKLDDGVEMENGQMMVNKNGEKMTMDQEMTMNDGTKVMTDGSVVKPDGTTVQMKDGDAMLMDGTMTTSDKMMMPAMENTMGMSQETNTGAMLQGNMMNVTKSMMNTNATTTTTTNTNIDTKAMDTYGKAM